MGFQGAHQRALLAFGAQRRIHLEEALATDADQLTGHAGGFGVGGFGNKNNIHVGNVVEFLSTTFAHGEHRHLTFVVFLPPHHGDGNGQRGGERGVGKRGQHARDLVERHQGLAGAARGFRVCSSEIVRGDAHQQRAVGALQGFFRVGTGQSGTVSPGSGECRACRRIQRRGLHTLQQLAHHLGGSGHRLRQQPPQPRVRSQVIPHRRGRPHKGQQPHTKRHVRADSGIKIRVFFPVGIITACQLVTQTDQRIQRKIRVASPRQRPQQLHRLAIKPTKLLKVRLGCRAIEPQSPQRGHGSAGGS